MKKIIEVLASFVLASAMMLGVGMSGATASTVGNVHGVSVSTAELREREVLVRKAQNDFRRTATPEDYERAVAAFEEMRQNHAQRSMLREVNSESNRTIQWCVSIPKWAVQAYAWYVIFQGGATAAVGGFLDATILGLPAGAVLNALGIGVGLNGTALLWWTDQTSWPKTVCI